MSGDSHLRPVERVVLRLNGENLATSEIACRIGKKPGTVERIREMVDYKEGLPPKGDRQTDNLRPLERVILRLREQGETYGEIGNRLGKSGAHIRRIEGYARLKS